MAKEYIPLFLDFNETTQDLSDEECGRLVRAIIEYANDREYEHKLIAGEKIAFRFLKGLVDRNNAISEARSRAGANKNKEEQIETISNKPEQNETKANKSEQSETKSITNTKTKTDIETKTKIEKPQKRFSPPTLDEVTEYCKERNNAVNPQRFIDFYESKGWKVGNQPMRDWKACVRTWEQREQNGKPKTSTVVAQQYSQRDYSNVQEELLQKQREEFELMLSRA